MPDTYWTYKHNGEIEDMEASDGNEAYNVADNEFQTECENNGEADGEERDIEIIGFHYDDEGERIVTSTKEETLIYERGYDEYEEHNTMWNAI